MNFEWENLVTEFRKLGGIADNVYQKEGENGRGIFPVDPTISSRIFTPSNLLISPNDIYLEEHKIKIRENSRHSKEISEFFNSYQENLSWGRGGKEAHESFEKGLSLFPYKLKKLIKDNILVDIEKRHKSNWNDIILRQFLSARLFSFRNKSFIVPFLELVNHEVKSLPYLRFANGLSTPNYPSKSCELVHSYGYKSSLNRLFNYGFFCKETKVFSFPFQIDLVDIGISLACKGLELSNDLMKIEKINQTIIIEGLPIADKNIPSLPKDYIIELFSRLNLKYSPIELLSKINSMNNIKRKTIVEELIKLDNYSALLLMQAINYELGLISKL